MFRILGPFLELYGILKRLNEILKCYMKTSLPLSVPSLPLSIPSLPISISYIFPSYNLPSSFLFSFSFLSPNSIQLPFTPSLSIPSIHLHLFISYQFYSPCLIFLPRPSSLVLPPSSFLLPFSLLPSCISISREINNKKC